MTFQRSRLLEREDSPKAVIPMPNEETYKLILDSIPYRIVFCDTDNIIRYLNKEARYHYYEVRGYEGLVGKSICDCNSPETKAMMLKALEKIKNHGNEIYLGVSVENERKYLNPVRNEKGELVGYFERFERNLQK